MYSQNTKAQVRLYLKLYKGTRLDINKMAKVIGISPEEVMEDLIDMHCYADIKLSLPNRIGFELLECSDDTLEEGESDIVGFVPDVALTAQIPEESMGSAELAFPGESMDGDQPAKEVALESPEGSCDDFDFDSEAFMDEEQF